MTFQKFVKKVDWALLRRQKALLLEVAHKQEKPECEALTGLVHLLDDLMDQAVNEVPADESIVFGTTSNENCLEHVKCPKCGQEKQFEIEANTAVMVRDDGTDETRDMEWDCFSHINCLECGHEGKFWQFHA